MLEDKNTAVHNVVIEQLKQINMTGYNSGIYLLQLTTDNTAKTFKLIKR